jgi:nucleoside-diphosphate-sugar epimerase
MRAISPNLGPVAVTGCSGFIGGHVVNELSALGYEVRACLRDSSSWRGRDCIQYLSGLANVEVIDGCDLFEPRSYDDAFLGCSAVFHAAAVLGNSAAGNSQPHGSGDPQIDVYQGGVAGTQNIINSINSTPSVRRLIYTSSIAAVVDRQRHLAQGYEWTEVDWADDDVRADVWASPGMSYSRSKVDSERLVNAAAEESDGQWDAVTINPAFTCGPLLFRAQLGQWNEQLGRIAAGLPPTWDSPLDRYYNIIDVRDIAKAQRLAAEANYDHRATLGGARYILQGSGGRSALRLGTDIVEIIAKHFPSFILGQPESPPDSDRFAYEERVFFDCKKAKGILGATIRSVDETIIETVASQIELGIIFPQLNNKS